MRWALAYRTISNQCAPVTGAWKRRESSPSWLRLRAPRVFGTQMVASGPGSIGEPSKGSIEIPDGPYESRRAVSVGDSVLEMNLQCRRLETTNPV